IGSLVGVVGSSGIHVKPFVPFFRMIIPPFPSLIMMVAYFATPAGAADMAFFISASLSAARAGTYPTPAAASAVRRRWIRKRIITSLGATMTGTSLRVDYRSQSLTRLQDARTVG